MKKLLFAIAAVAVTMSACKKDEVDGVIDESPSLSLVSSANYISSNVTVEAGSLLNFSIKASSFESVKLKSFVVTRAFNGNDAIVVPGMTDINETTFTDSINVSAASEFGQEVWTFIITDKKDNVASKSIIITTNDGATENLTGSFYHIAGALKGSYDLVDNAQVSATPTQPDALKDMKNTDLAGATFTGSWETKNDTRFVKSLVAYSDLTMSAAALEFNQASVTLSIVPSPSVGDVYIAKLRGEENYTVISITENNPTADCGATCTNKGRLSFSYKK